MKAGYFIGLRRDEQQIVLNSKYQTLEEFMAANNITDPKDVLLPYQDPKFAEKVKEELVELLIINIHGSEDPRVCSAARNTSLFKPRGPAMGHISADLQVPLLQWVVDTFGGQPTHPNRRVKTFTFGSKEEFERYRKQWANDIVSVDEKNFSFKAYD